MITKMEKRRFVHEFVLVLLLALAIGAIALYSNSNHFTGFVVGPNGESCGENWTCGDWTTDCIKGNYTRTCTLDVNSTSICVSPITEYQTCEVQNNSVQNNDSTSCTESLVNNTGSCVDGIQIVTSTQTYANCSVSSTTENLTCDSTPQQTCSNNITLCTSSTCESAGYH